MHTSFSYTVMGELGVPIHVGSYLLPCPVLPLLSPERRWQWRRSVWREGWGEHSMGACVRVHDKKAVVAVGVLTHHFDNQ